MKTSVLLISLFAVFASLEVALSLKADGLCTVAAIMNNDHEQECSVVDCQQSCEEIGPLLGRCNRVSDDKSKCHCYASCFALAYSDIIPLPTVVDAPAPLVDSSDAPSPDSDTEAPLPSFNEEYNAEAPLADSDAPLSSFGEDAPSPDSDTEAPLPSFNEEYAEAPLADSDAPLSSLEEYNAEAALADDSEAPSGDTNIDPPLPGFEEYNAEAPTPDIEWDAASAPSIWISN